MPKSAIFTCPSAAQRTFSGLMSRWTIPAAWAKASPAQTSRATRTASANGIGIRAPTVPPGTSSMTR